MSVINKLVKVQGSKQGQ